MRINTWSKLTKNAASCEAAFLVIGQTLNLSSFPNRGTMLREEIPCSSFPWC